MKKNILVFPCGSEIGLEIYKSLSFSTHFELYGGSSVDDHGKFTYQNYIDDLPFLTDPNFVQKINSVIDKHKIEFIIPAHDSAVLLLAEEKSKGNLHCEVITSPFKTCKILRSKLKTYDYFKNVISTPRVYTNVDELNGSHLPIFLKPDIGQGSKGTYLAKSLDDVSFYMKKDPSLMLLEYLPGKEYTIDCFTDKSGSILFCEGRERKRISNGISVNSFSVRNDEFLRLAEIINHQLEFTGAWFFQVKESAAGELVLMEISPRIAGTMGLVRCKGVNLVLLSLFNAMGYVVSVFKNEYSIVIDRALHNVYEHDLIYSHAYIDLDDLIIFEEKINPMVMAFIFQCINNKVKVHILTRHRGNLSETLKKYRLDGIFDDLILVKDSDEKHPYIKEKNAIFVDDSFAERKKVHEKLGIPVFDYHMLEALMENF